mgnify:CR=1 FL=1
MDEFWGMESESTLRAVDVYITKLRDKFSGCTGFSIATVRGLGYKAVLKRVRCPSTLTASACRGTSSSSRWGA